MQPFRGNPGHVSQLWTRPNRLGKESNFCETRFQWPISETRPREAWIRNTCCFSLDLRKLFILCFPDCFIWQILGEMASSFPRVLEAACLFLQLAILQGRVTGTHMEGWCHSWPHYFTEIQGLDRVSWAAKGQVQRGQCISHLCYWWLLFAALPRCLPKSTSFTVHWESLSHWICYLCFLHPWQESPSILPPPKKSQCTRAMPFRLFWEKLSLEADQMFPADLRQF